MGISLSFLAPWSLYELLVESYPPRPQWSPDNIGDLSGKVVLITGANSGLGYESAKVLAAHGAKVYVAARSTVKGMVAVENINKELAQTDAPGHAAFLHMDLMDLQSVKDAAELFLSEEDRLDILMNSAGVMLVPKETEAASAVDVQFHTNVLGHVALTRYLLPTLISTAKAADEGTVRVVNVASMAHFAAPPGGIRFDNLSGGFSFQRYGQSKLANIVFSNELARRLSGTGVLSVAIHPGNIETDLWRYSRRSIFSLNTVVAKEPVQRGALTQLYAATAPEIESGAYYVPWARKANPVRKEAYDPVLGKRLWDWCSAQMTSAGVGL